MIRALALALCLMACPAMAQEPPQKFTGKAIQFPKPGFQPFKPRPPAGPVPGLRASSTPMSDLASFLATVAVPDLQRALDLANAQNPPDVTSAQCWGGLIPVVQQLQTQLSNPDGTPIGLATTIQIARDILNAPTSPMLKQVNLACAALFIDIRVGALNFAANLGGVLAGAAILAPIKVP